MFYTRLLNLFSLCSLALLIITRLSSADSLAQFAATVRLDRTPSTTTIIIDEKMIKENRSSGAVTICSQAIAEAPAATTPKSDQKDQGKRRIYWHRLHNQQVERITKVRTKLTEIDARIEELDAKEFSVGNSGKARATLQASLKTMRTKRQTQADVLSREEAKLRSLIRQARAEGAQPGWFR